MSQKEIHITAERIIGSLYRLMYSQFRALTNDKGLFYVLSILYAYHKGYCRDEEIITLSHLYNKEDSLLKDILSHIEYTEQTDRILNDITVFFNKNIDTEFDTLYKELLEEFCDRLNYGYDKNVIEETKTPAEITKLISYFIKKSGYTSIYEPFCGTASLASELMDGDKQIKYVGQEINGKTALIARVRAEAVNGKDIAIETSDSIRNWKGEMFDVVATCPPAGLRVPGEVKQQINFEQEFEVNSIDDLVLTRPFLRNRAKMAVALLPQSFCFDESRLKLRRFLIERNLLDTIIFLPGKCLYTTSIPFVIVVCKKDRAKNEPIKLVRADDCCNVEHFRVIVDVNRAIDSIEGKTGGSLAIDCETIKKFNYGLNPYVYTECGGELKEGQKLVRLKEVLTLVHSKKNPSENKDAYVEVKGLSRMFKEILMNRNKIAASDRESNVKRIYKYYASSSDKYLLCSSIYRSRSYGLYSMAQPFKVQPYTIVYKINETLVTPEYIAYLLCKPNVVETLAMTNNIDLDVPVVIDSIERQKEIVEQEIQGIYQKISEEKEADAKRLGVKQNISDLEHILGSTQLRIAKIISRLENIKPDSDKYAHHIKSLKDNVEYMNRVIHFSNALIDSETFNKKSGNLYEYLGRYIESWKNYGGEYFELQFDSTIDDVPTSSFDEMMLTVMLDSIMNNAVRHGFHKNKNYREKNIVKCSLSMVEYQGKPYFLLSVANNGKEMSDGFTIEDYISKGRYTSDTGRSGLGGYHIYQVVKGHNGFMSLSKQGEWNVVVDILLPAGTDRVKNIPYYGNECI